MTEVFWQQYQSGKHPAANANNVIKSNANKIQHVLEELK